MAFSKEYLELHKDRCPRPTTEGRERRWGFRIWTNCIFQPRVGSWPVMTTRMRFMHRAQMNEYMQGVSVNAITEPSEIPSVN